MGCRHYQSGYPGNRMVAVPFIRLSGRWLEHAGFVQGAKVVITIGDGEIRLVCTRPTPAQPQQGQLF